MPLDFINDFEKSELSKTLRHILSMPFIYIGIVPIVILDIFLTIYHNVTFPLYGIEKVKRKDYIIYDREFMKQLDWIQKFNCLYCSYANGLMAYGVEIVGRTERYWCPLKHSKRMEGEHKYVQEFAEFGDIEGFQKLYNEIENTGICARDNNYYTKPDK